MFYKDIVDGEKLDFVRHCQALLIAYQGLNTEENMMAL